MAGVMGKVGKLNC